MINKKPSEIKVLLVMAIEKEVKIPRYRKELEKVGIVKKNISLCMLNKKAKEKDLKGIDCIYVCGGNTFHYLDRIRKTGLDKKIKKFVRRGIVYFGVSAGSIIAGPNIDIASPFDKNDIKLKNLTGLKLTGMIVNPHHTRKDEKAVREIEKKLKRKILRLTDMQALLIKNGRNPRVVG